MTHSAAQHAAVLSITSGSITFMNDNLTIQVSAASSGQALRTTGPQQLLQSLWQLLCSMLSQSIIMLSPEQHQPVHDLT